jgi:hypothetical protein
VTANAHQEIVGLNVTMNEVLVVHISVRNKTSSRRSLLKFETRDWQKPEGSLVINNHEKSFSNRKAINK